MAAGWTTATRNAMLTAEQASSAFVSAHTAFPGDAGSSEVSGVPYVRQAVAYGAAAGGQMSNSAPISIPIPVGNVVTWLGLWTLVAVGVHRANMPLGGNAGTPFYVSASDDTFRSDGHGLANGDQIVLMDTNIGGVPGGFTEGTVYFVRDVAGDTFKLAATSGGAAIDATTDGTGFVTRVTPADFTLLAGTIEIAAGQLVANLLR